MAKRALTPLQQKYFGKDHAPVKKGKGSKAATKSSKKGSKKRK